MQNLPFIGKKESQKGQALLIVLLGMAVVLTIVLSVVTRSITDVTITTRDEAATRAFSAAEAGIESALIDRSLTAVPVNQTVGDAEYESTTVGLGVGYSEYEIPGTIISGESLPVWFVSQDGAGHFVCSATEPCFFGSGMEVCWGKSGENSSGTAVEVSIYYDITRNSLGTPPGFLDVDFSGVQVARVAYDVSGTNATFTDASIGCGISGYQYTTGMLNLTGPPYNINASCGGSGGCFLYASVKMFYAGLNDGQSVAVRVQGGTLSAQGIQVNSTGTYGDSVRELQAKQTYRSPLSIFESAIISKDGITKP